MAKRTGKLAILAGSALLICVMAGGAMAFGPQRGGMMDGDGGKHMMGPDGWNMGYHEGFGGHRNGFDRFLVDQGVAAETVNAFVADQDKWRSESAEAMKTMRAKGLELYAEMSKAQPDAARAKALQSELSQLRAQLDDKRIDNMLYMKKTYPQICEIMQQKMQDRPCGPNFGGKGQFGPGGKPGPDGKPGPGGKLGPDGKPGPNR